MKNLMKYKFRYYAIRQKNVDLNFPTQATDNNNYYNILFL